MCLTLAIWDINFWPTDTRIYYFDAAVQLPHLNYLSDIHKNVDDVKIRWLHGKEIFILFASYLQRCLNDVETLRPFVLVCVLSILFSSIFIYFITKKYWGKSVGLICYGAFVFSLWPYLYILFAKHQPLGLFFFLLAYIILQNGILSKFKYVFCLLSGIALGLSFFSSTVSSLYFPFYIVGFLFHSKKIMCKSLKGLFLSFFVPGLFVLLGCFVVFLYVNWPDVLYNMQLFKEYVHISGAFNHFFYNQPFLQKWFTHQMVAQTRGGWLWIFKYFFIIMPVLFPIYLFAVIGVILKYFKSRKKFSRHSLGWLGMIVLSLVPPLMAEYIQAAQYGANYFPSLIGIVMFVGYSAFYFLRYCNKMKKVFLVFLFCLGGLHIFVNGYIFVQDVYPCRMATTFLSKKLEQHKTEKFYTYMYNPHRNHFLLYLSPKILHNVRFVPIEYIVQPKDGYILIPPVTGDSIYIAAISTYTDFDDDIFLNELIRRGTLEKYALASYKTLANSRIWLHEEEILSYRNLILNDSFEGNDIKGRLWLLDVEKIQRDQEILIPDKDYMTLFQKNIRNIGTKEKIYMYEGYTGKIPQTTNLKHVLARIYKIGNPQDDLIVYVYKVHDEQVVWVPLGENFMSLPLSAHKVLSDPNDGLGVFRFSPPLKLEKGSYFFIIHRTGLPDDQNYYRIHNGYLGMI